MKFYTYTGKMIDMTSPSPDAIDIRDIAHALSQICRASGHFKHFYSVAQHSINCLKEAIARNYSEKVCLACLLHDSQEAYLCDIPTPLKYHLPDYKKIENNFEEKVWEKFGIALSDYEKKLVKSVDEAILYYEFKKLHTIPISFAHPPVLISVPRVEYMDMKDVERLFISEFMSFGKIEKTA